MRGDHMPKIPEHAKMRAFHGGYPDEPNATTAAERDRGHHAPHAKQYVCILRDGGYCMEEADDGNYVSHADYETLRRQYDATAEGYRAALLALRQALIAHRADLHNGSKRPCPTCRQSAKALGIDGKVPDSCAYAETDRAALAATPQEKR